jgi:hypothetical protein
MRARKEHGSPLRKRNRSEVAYAMHVAVLLGKPSRSRCIDMNAFSINPDLVVVDRNLASLIQLLEKQGRILTALQNVGRGGLASKQLSRFKSRRNRI